MIALTYSRYYWIESEKSFVINNYFVSMNMYRTGGVLFYLVFKFINGFAWRRYNHYYFIIFQSRQNEKRDDLLHSRCQRVCILIKTRAIEIRVPIMYATRSFSLLFSKLNLKYCVYFSVCAKNENFPLMNLHKNYLLSFNSGFRNGNKCENVFLMWYSVFGICTCCCTDPFNLNLFIFSTSHFD